MRLIITFLSLYIVNSLSAQTESLEKVILNDLIQETQINLSNDHNIHLYWWVPAEYWEVAMLQDPTTTKEQIKEFIEPLKGYTIMMVVRGKLGYYGGVSYDNADTVRNNLVMIDEYNKEYKPLNEEDLSNEVSLIVDIIKPMMANMLGEMGSNMQFFVFSNKMNRGKEIFSPYSSNAVKVRCLEDEVKWRTPLGSLYKRKKCPIDEESFVGTYKFCPYHGDELVSQ